ncbi:hypothetical protein ACHAPO_010304 [Fusarium lateritium]
MEILPLFVLLFSFSQCHAKPLEQPKPTVTQSSGPDFAVNAIIPTASGQIGINPVDIPQTKDYTASIGVDTEYLTELVQDGKTSTDWIGTATDFGLVTYTTTIEEEEPIETAMARGFLVARHEDGQVEITLSKRMKDELHEVDDLVPKCDAGDQDCLMQRPGKFLTLLVKRAVPLRAAEVLARDIGDLTGIEVGSTAAGGLIAIGASEGVITAASELLAGLIASVEVGSAVVTGGVGAAVIAGIAILWGLNDEFSQEWKLKTDAKKIELPKNPSLSCPISPLACMGERCQGGKGAICTNEWKGCPCDVSSLGIGDTFFLAGDWPRIQQALSEFVLGKDVDIDAKCYAGEESKYSVDMDEEDWKSTLDKFCETKPLLRDSFDETWTDAELGVTDYNGWSFTFQLECNEKDACEGYVCEDVFEKFKSCVEDGQTINWGQLDLDCGTLTYSIDDGEAEDTDKKSLEWDSDPSCFASDEFGDHKDVWDHQVKDYATWACRNADDSPVKKDDSDSFIFFQRWAWGAPYQYNIWWKDGCELDNGATEQWANDPLDDGSSKICEATLFDAWNDCNNGGTGGSWTAGCLVYEFRAEDSGTTSNLG